MEQQEWNLSSYHQLNDVIDIYSQQISISRSAGLMIH